MRPSTNSTEAVGLVPGAAGRATAGETRHLRRAAVLLCLIPAFYLMLTAAYALLNFGEYSSDMPRLLRYVAGPLGIAAALGLAAWLLKPDAALVTGITATSILASMFLFEVYATAKAFPRKAGVAGVVNEDVPLEGYMASLPPLYTIKNLNGALGVETLDAAVLSAVPGKEVLLCSQQGQPVSYTADRFGFRNPGQAGAGTVRLMVLGDSFTEGICLSEGRHFVDRIREGGGATVNVGSRGAGPLFELAVLGRYGPVLKPEITLMAFFEGNDWDNLASELKMPWLTPALAPGSDFGTPEWSPTQRARAAAVLDQWWNTSASPLMEYIRRQRVFRNFFALQKTAVVLGVHYPRRKQPNPAYARVLARAREIAAGWEGEVVLVYLPSLDRFGGVFPHKFVHEPLREMVRGAAAEAGLRVIDLTPAFEAHGRPKSLYAQDAHFNVAGAAFAAQTILRDLERTQAAPGPTD